MFVGICLATKTFKKKSTQTRSIPHNLHSHWQKHPQRIIQRHTGCQKKNKNKTQLYDASVVPFVKLKVKKHLYCRVYRILKLRSSSKKKKTRPSVVPSSSAKIQISNNRGSALCSRGRRSRFTSSRRSVLRWLSNASKSARCSARNILVM